MRSLYSGWSARVPASHWPEGSPKGTCASLTERGGCNTPNGRKHVGPAGPIALRPSGAPGRRCAWRVDRLGLQLVEAAGLLHVVPVARERGLIGEGVERFHPTSSSHGVARIEHPVFPLIRIPLEVEQLAGACRPSRRPACGAACATWSVRRDPRRWPLLGAVGRTMLAQ